MTDLPAWSHAVVDIPDRGLDMKRQATDVDRANLTREFNLVALERLDVVYRIEPQRRSRYLLTGRITANMTQTCVVTLEPIATRLDERLEVEFWPAEQIEAANSEREEEELAPSDRDVEPIEEGGIAVGRIVMETLSTAIDLYPRKPDAHFTWQDEKAAAATVNPFAALARLKSPKEPDGSKT